MHQVLGHHRTVIASNGAGRGLSRVRGTHQGSHDGEGVVGALENGDECRAAAHERDQVTIKRLLDVFCVVLGERLGVEEPKLSGDELEALALESIEDLSNVATLNSVRLTNYESSAHVTEGIAARSLRYDFP